ncbi:hypothetical protein BS78_02G340400 [Paspalum vaginatum]|nr:hypothetical protein BS78_02G340400 [Paspalum vaginatum]
MIHIGTERIYLLLRQQLGDVARSWLGLWHRVVTLRLGRKLGLRQRRKLMLRHLWHVRFLWLRQFWHGRVWRQFRLWQLRLRVRHLRLGYLRHSRMRQLWLWHLRHGGVVRQLRHSRVWQLGLWNPRHGGVMRQLGLWVLRHGGVRWQLGLWVLRHGGVRQLRLGQLRNSRVWRQLGLGHLRHGGMRRKFWLRDLWNGGVRRVLLRLRLLQVPCPAAHGAAGEQQCHEEGKGGGHGWLQNHVSDGLCFLNSNLYVLCITESWFFS